jgi:hypothetical protein
VADDDITAGEVGAERHHDAARFRGRERVGSVLRALQAYVSSMCYTFPLRVCATHRS